MLEIARFGARLRLRTATAVSVAVGLLALLYLAFFPAVEESGAELDAYLENLPPALRNAFGGFVSLSTIEGFLAIELYNFFWVVVLGAYFAYAAGGLIAGEVERRRLDLLLARPVSRGRVVVESYLSLVPEMVVINLVVAVALLAGLPLIDQSVALDRLALVHALSLPYWLACAGIGLVASVLTDRARRAGGAAAGVVFVAYVVGSVTLDTALELLGAVAPSRYYDPVAILAMGEVAWADAAVLLVAAAALVGVSVVAFRRRDVPA